MLSISMAYNVISCQKIQRNSQKLIWVLSSEMRKNCQKNGSVDRDLLNILYMYGIFYMPPSESSCTGNSEHVWQRGVEGVLGWIRGDRSLPYIPKKTVNAVSKKTSKATIFKRTLPKGIGVGSYKLWEAADSFWKQYFENCGRACFYRQLIILLKDHIFGYEAIYKKVPFFTDFSCRLQKKSIGLVYPQFWCHRPSQ